MCNLLPLCFRGKAVVVDSYLPLLTCMLTQIDEEHVFGKGAVDSRGLPAKGSEATGYQDWIMTKVSTETHIIQDPLILIAVCSGNIDD